MARGRGMSTRGRSGRRRAWRWRVCAGGRSRSRRAGRRRVCTWGGGWRGMARRRRMRAGGGGRCGSAGRRRVSTGSRGGRWRARRGRVGTGCRGGSGCAWRRRVSAESRRRGGSAWRRRVSSRGRRGCRSAGRRRVSAGSRGGRRGARRWRRRRLSAHWEDHHGLAVGGARVGRVRVAGRLASAGARDGDLEACVGRSRQRRQIVAGSQMEVDAAHGAVRHREGSRVRDGVGAGRHGVGRDGEAHEEGVVGGGGTGDGPRCGPAAAVAGTRGLHGGRHLDAVVRRAEGVGVGAGGECHRLARHRDRHAGPVCRVQVDGAEDASQEHGIA